MRLVPLASLKYQLCIWPMFFPHFTDQEITIDGLWQGDDRQLRFTGTISSSAPFVMLSLLKYGDEYHSRNTTSRTPSKSHSTYINRNSHTTIDTNTPWWLEIRWTQEPFLKDVCPLPTSCPWHFKPVNSSRSVWISRTSLSFIWLRLRSLISNRSDMGNGKSRYSQRIVVFGSETTGAPRSNVCFIEIWPKVLRKWNGITDRVAVVMN